MRFLAIYLSLGVGFGPAAAPDPRAPVPASALDGAGQAAPRVSPDRALVPPPPVDGQAGDAPSAGSGVRVPPEPAPEPLGPEPGADPTDPAGDADAYDPLRDSPQAMRNRHWIATGAVLVSVGAILGIGAVAMGLSDPCDPRAGNSCVEEARNRGAWSMGAPAIAMTVGGLSALAVGYVRQRRLQASFGAGPGQASAAVTWRF